MQQGSEQRRRVTRRRFMQIGAAACACCAAGAAGVAVETAPIPAPYTGSEVRATPTLSDTGAPPILLIADGAAPGFAPYLGAILRAEGMPAFRFADLATLDGAVLRRAAVAILAPAALDTDRVELLETYVRGGGNLIALDPDPLLADLLGVRFVAEPVAGGYLRIVGGEPITRGISGSTLQFHAPARNARTAGARPLAHLSRSDGSMSDAALVTVNTVGKGTAAMWAFDLARSVALTRQGNPEWVDQDRDPIEGVRTQDLFVGWADLERLDIPQADEQQRLLVNMVSALAAAPLPRLWYFPARTDALIVATGDAHGILSSHIQAGLDIFARYGSSVSVYYSTPPVSPQRRLVRRLQWQAGELPVVGAVFDDRSGYPTPRNIRQWREQGHGFGLHPFVERGLREGYSHSWNDFVKHGYGEPDPTVRTHRVLWSGWVETARVQASYGVRMNLDFYRAGRHLSAGNDRADGYLNGTGLPMPFVDERGALLNIFQQQTHLIDEHLLPIFDNGFDMGYTAEEAIAVSSRTIDQAIDRYPSALGMQFHFDPLSFDDQKIQASIGWLEGTLAYAAARSIPAMSAERWLRFTQARYDAQFSAIDWNAEAGRLTFRVDGDGNAVDAMEVMVPLEHAGRQLRQFVIDGAPAPQRERTIGGRRYAVASVGGAGRHIEAGYG